MLIYGIIKNHQKRPSPTGHPLKQILVSQTLAGIFIFSQCLILMEHLSKMTTLSNT